MVVLGNKIVMKYHNDEKLYLSSVVFCLPKGDESIRQPLLGPINGRNRLPITKTERKSVVSLIIER
jgi:hypothetical protein